MFLRLKKTIHSWSAESGPKEEISLNHHDFDTLRTHALSIGNKNNTLTNIIDELLILERDHQTDKRPHRLIESVKNMITNTREWDLFDQYFDELHKDFRTLALNRYPNITANELRLMILVKIKLSNIEIGNTLNISQEGVKKARYRLRKKLGLKTSESLGKFIISF